MGEDVRKFKCLVCGHTWEVPFGSGRQMICPKCKKDKIKRTNPGKGARCRKKERKGHEE